MKTFLISTIFIQSSIFSTLRGITSRRPRPIADLSIPIEVQSRWTVQFADDVRPLLAGVILPTIAMGIMNGRSVHNIAGTALVDVAVEIPASRATVTTEVGDG